MHERVKTIVSRSSCTITENISLQSYAKYNADAYSETYQTSKMESFAKIVNKRP